MEASEAINYKCSKCQEIFTRKAAIHHFILHHVPLSSVPFYCSLCSFRAFSKNSLLLHMKKWATHRMMAKQYPYATDFLQESIAPYNVTWGRTDEEVDLYVCINGEEIIEEVVEEEEVIEEVFVEEDEGKNDTEITIQEADNEFEIEARTKECQTDEDIRYKELKQEMRVDKGKYQAEMKRMGAYVERLEKKLQDRDVEIKRLKKELQEWKDGNRWDDGFEEMWEREEQKTKRMRSEVKKVYNIPKR